MDTYFRTTSYALVITAFLALALTGELDWISIVLYSLAVVASFYSDLRKSEARGVKRSRWRTWLWRAGAFAYVPFLFIDAMVVSNRILALTHMTLFVSAVKLYQHKRDRDWVFLYLIAFFQILLAAGLTFNATFVASLITFLFFFISSLAAFEIRRARRELASSEEEIIAPIKPAKRKYKASETALPVTGSRKRVRYLVGATIGQLAMIALLTLPFFFLIPRFGGGGVARGFGDTPATGFSDKVELGQVARIKKSQQVVMRVELNPMPNRYLRWRGIALERYNGSMWSVSDSEPVDRLKTQSQGRNSVGDGSASDSRFDRRYALSEPTEQPQLQTEQQRQTIIEQKIILEPLDTPTLFAARRPIRISGPLPSITRDEYTDALTANRLRGRTAYSVFSDISVPSEQELKADSPALSKESIKLLNLQLPKLDPRIRELAHELTRNAPTAYDKAKEIENFLKTKFGYTLNLKINSSDPLAEFLFDVREGHCEYFATAMVVMLRTLRIPARIVNGFQMGEYNDINRLFIVRESDAHSWVEVYFPRTNSWIEFDPTPPAGINDYSQGGMLARLRKYMDAMEVFWLDYIVTLDSEEQASIMSSIQQKLLAVKDRLIAYYLDAKQWTRKTLSFITARDWSATDWVKLSIALALLFAMTTALYVALHIKRWSIAPTGYGPWWHRLFILPTWRSRRLVRRDTRESAVMFYEQMLAIASRAGLVKQPSQTPKEFAAVSGFNEIQEITVLYNRVRFGGASLDETEARKVTNLLAELRHSIRRKK
ncbi:MAG: transglutaminaseTgpA domain-containing protein [Blastocatellia bacterium]